MVTGIKGTPLAYNAATSSFLLLPISGKTTFISCSEVPGVILNGNTCITAAVTEMLLQSHTGVIDLLPALPTILRQGSVKGLVTRGDFVVNLKWSNHQLTTASLTAKQSSPCKIKLDNHYKIYLNSKAIVLHKEGNNVYSFDAGAGKTYVIK